MTELGQIKAAVNPDDTLLVVDAMTGQEAATLTATFNDDIGISGAILTKMDGDTRGGAALSVRAVSGKPIKFMVSIFHFLTSYIRMHAQLLNLDYCIPLT